MKITRTVYENRDCMRCQENTKHQTEELDDGRQVVKCYRCDELTIVEAQVEAHVA